MGGEEEFVGGQGGGHGGGEEVAGTLGAAARGAGDVEGGVQADGDGGELGGGVGVGQAAADGAAGAEFAVADPGQSHAQQGHRGGERVQLGLALADGRADVQGVIGAGQLVQAFDGVDVDQNGGAAQAHGQDRHQGLPAGQDLALLIGVSQGDHGGLDRGRAQVIERGRLHARCTGAMGYRPSKRGLRFSVKAATPSAKSAVERSMA